MKKLIFPLVVVAAFSVSFASVWAWQFVQAGGSMISLVFPQVQCEMSEEQCRARMRADARFRMGFGDDRGGLAIYRRLALAGDAKAAFQIGWYHDEAYRKEVGRALVAGTPIPEGRRYAVGDLPKGAAFEALVNRYAAPPTDPERRQASRALAFLWYELAAQGGFGPAMNNLAAMYQFGMTGEIDKSLARRWYVAAYDTGTPAAALNLGRLRNIGYDNHVLDCEEQSGSWLPLVIMPPIEYLKEDVIEHTRFRGLRSDRTIIGLIEMQMKQIPTSTPKDDVASKAALEVIASSEQLVSGPSSLGTPVYDDETPESRREIPSFADAQTKSFENAKAMGDCHGISPDPRTMRADAIIQQRVLGKLAAKAPGRNITP